MGVEGYSVCRCGLMFSAGQLDEKQKHEKEDCDGRFKGYRTYETLRPVRLKKRKTA